MSQSRKNPGRKKNLDSYKQKIKELQNMNKQIKQSQASPAQAEPEIRQSPVWNAADVLEISGQELKTILDFIEQSTSAFYAVNAVMSRNIVSGKVQLKFEKFDKTSSDYVEMTPEEEAPYQEEVQKAIRAAIAIQNGQTATPQEPGPITAEEQKDLPRLDTLVDANGNPYPTVDAPNANE